MNKTIKDYSDLELKGLHYDNLVNIEVAQARIKAINEELGLRQQALSQKPVEMPDIPKIPDTPEED